MKDNIQVVGFFSIIIIIILAVILTWGWAIKGSYNDLHDPYKANIGRSVVINTDTLTVVNYSTISGSYTLSNGVTIDKEVIKQLNTKEDE